MTNEYLIQIWILTSIFSFSTKVGIKHIEITYFYRIERVRNLSYKFAFIIQQSYIENY